MVESYIDAHDEGSNDSYAHYTGYNAAKAQVIVPLDSVDSSLVGVTLKITVWSNRQFTHTLDGSDETFGDPEKFEISYYSPELTLDNSTYSVKISDSQSGLSGTSAWIEANSGHGYDGDNSDERFGSPIITKTEQYYSGSGTLTITLTKN